MYLNNIIICNGKNNLHRKVLLIILVLYLFLSIKVSDNVDTDNLSKDTDENDTARSNSSSDTEDDNEMESERTIADSSSEFMLFRCSDEKCIKWYRSMDRCESHILSGVHVYPPEKMSLVDAAIRTYKTQTDKISSNAANASTTTVLLTHPNDLNYLEQGWALARSQPNKCFTKQQIEFLVEKYEEGQRSGYKWNPAAVAMANIFVGIKKSEFASLDNEKREDKW